jgi:hypothetical protein
MKIKSSICAVLVIMLLTPFVTLFAQEAADSGGSSDEETPWLKGVEISPYPTEISPVIPLKIYLDNGEPIPATMTEDVPVVVVADTTIFDPTPPAEYKGEEIPGPKWVKSAAVSWFFIDWEKNKNFQASASQVLALNQMEIVPLMPTGRGAVTCHIGRKMSYDAPEPGKRIYVFANSSGAKDVRVLDITPPTCGLEIQVVNGKSGTFWVAENPPNKYPLPKLADVYFTGALVQEDNPEEIITIQGLELGPDMIVDPETVAINVKADSEIVIRVVGEDNYKLDNDKLRYGICEGAGGEPNPIGPENASSIKLSNIKIPDNPYLYIDASDVAGNRQVLFVALKVK